MYSQQFRVGGKLYSTQPGESIPSAKKRLGLAAADASGGQASVATPSNGRVRFSYKKTFYWTHPGESHVDALRRVIAAERAAAEASKIAPPPGAQNTSPPKSSGRTYTHKGVSFKLQGAETMLVAYRRALAERQTAQSGWRPDIRLPRPSGEGQRGANMPPASASSSSSSSSSSNSGGAPANMAPSPKRPAGKYHNIKGVKFYVPLGGSLHVEYAKALARSRSGAGSSGTVDDPKPKVHKVGSVTFSVEPGETYLSAYKRAKKRLKDEEAGRAGSSQTRDQSHSGPPSANAGAATGTIEPGAGSRGREVTIGKHTFWMRSGESYHQAYARYRASLRTEAAPPAGPPITRTVGDLTFTVLPGETLARAYKRARDAKSSASESENANGPPSTAPVPSKPPRQSTAEVEAAYLSQWTGHKDAQPVIEEPASKPWRGKTVHVPPGSTWLAEVMKLEKQRRAERRAQALNDHSQGGKPGEQVSLGGNEVTILEQEQTLGQTYSNILRDQASGNPGDDDVVAGSVNLDPVDGERGAGKAGLAEGDVSELVYFGLPGTPCEILANVQFSTIEEMDEAALIGSVTLFITAPLWTEVPGH